MSAPDNPTKTRARSAARLAAVQALYQLDMTDAPVERVLDEFNDFRLRDESAGDRQADTDRALFGDILRNTAAASGDLDRSIDSALTPDWPIGRLDRVLKAILRAGSYELRDRPDIPARVVISEYVDISRAFFDGKEPGLVNGVLDKLARGMRVGELDQATNGQR